MEYIAPIVRNITILLSLTFIYSLLLPSLNKQKRVVRIFITGLLFGLFTIVTMNDPVRFTDGGIVDARHVIVLVCTMLTGWQGGLISAVVASIYRFVLGNPGVIPGIASIIGAFLIGVVYNRYTNKGVDLNWGIIVAGMLVPFSPLIALTTMADGIGWDDLPNIAPALIIAYPIGTFLLTQLLSFSKQRLELLDTVHQFEQRQDATFQLTPTLLMGVGLDRKILNINPAMVEFFGVSKDKLNNQHIDAVLQRLPEAFQSPFLAQLDHALSGATAHQLIEFRPQPDAPLMSVDTYCIPITDRYNQIQMVFVQAYDITQELSNKQKQLELAHAQQRNTMLEQIISDASHHLRTPLTVMGSTRYLIRKLTSNLTDEIISKSINGHLDKHVRAEKRLNDIISDLLHLMKVNHTTNLTFEDVNLPEFLRGVMNDYECVAVKEGKTFSMDIPSEPLSVPMIPSTIQHALENLVENGLRYTPEGGTVSVRLRVDNKLEEAIITVQDTGIGIPQEAHANIFDRFYRASNAQVYNKEGTGLGLAIVKDTLDSHNWTISLESQANVGTKFIIRLPAKITDVKSA